MPLSSRLGKRPARPTAAGRSRPSRSLPSLAGPTRQAGRDHPDANTNCVCVSMYIVKAVKGRQDHFQSRKTKLCSTACCKDYDEELREQSIKVCRSIDAAFPGPLNPPKPKKTAVLRLAAAKPLAQWRRDSTVGHSCCTDWHSDSSGHATAPDR
jgi:hypothetical protein